MSYSVFEGSTHGGAPYFLYRFTKNGVSYDFCSGPDDITSPVLGITFTSSHLSHGKIFVGKEIKRDTLEVEFALSDPFASSYLGVIDPGITTVTIWRGHYGDPDNEVKVSFRGRIQAAKTSERNITLIAVSVFSSLRNAGLRPRMQRSCRHVLYKGLCRLNITDFEEPLSLTAASNNIYTVAGANANGDGFYSGGVLNYNGSLAFILNQTGNTVKVRQSIPSLNTAVNTSGAQNVILAPGCNRSYDHCNNKFFNSDNYGGFRHMPIKNPFGSTSVV